jgi:hypothetical protein
LVWFSVALHVVVVAGLFAAHDVARSIGVALPAKYDALHRLRGWAPLGRAVSEVLRTHPGKTLLAEDREVLASLLYYARPFASDAVKWNPMGGIRDHFDLTTDITKQIGGDFIFITEGVDVSWTAARFRSFTPIGTITVPLGPDRARRYNLYEADGFKGYP